MANRIWILSYHDPEMVMIDRLLRKCGERVAYALALGKRVHPGNAYRGDAIQYATDCGTTGSPGEVWYLVECDVPVPASAIAVRIDHHRPGDPGYGRPPEEFMSASSIGQVIAELSRLGRLPTTWRKHDWASGVYYHAPTFVPSAYSAANPAFPRWIVGPRLEIPHDLVFCAAADHCLSAAYAGECPGVDPDELMRWRVATRAAFQQRPVEELLADVERAREALRRADPISLTARRDCPRCHGSGMYYDAHGHDSASGQPTADGYALCTCGGYGPQWAADLRGQHVPELPEAAAREGECFIANSLPGPDGRIKIVCQCGTPEEIEAFMRVWAPAHGLSDVYGDPARGFAGGYLP